TVAFRQRQARIDRLAPKCFEILTPGACGIGSKGHAAALADVLHGQEQTGAIAISRYSIYTQHGRAGLGAVYQVASVKSGKLFRPDLLSLLSCGAEGHDRMSQRRGRSLERNG